jgi:hypothetical protein
MLPHTGTEAMRDDVRIFHGEREHRVACEPDVPDRGIVGAWCVPDTRLMLEAIRVLVGRGNRG